MNHSITLVGSSLAATISDPWEFVTEHGSGPYEAIIEKVEGDAILARLTSPLVLNGDKHQFLVVTGRTENDSFDCLLRKEDINCNVQVISDTDVLLQDHSGLTSLSPALRLLGMVRAV